MQEQFYNTAIYKAVEYQ